MICECSLCSPAMPKEKKGCKYCGADISQSSIASEEHCSQKPSPKQGEKCGNSLHKDGECVVDTCKPKEEKLTDYCPCTNDIAKARCPIHGLKPSLVENPLNAEIEERIKSLSSRWCNFKWNIQGSVVGSDSKVLERDLRSLVALARKK